MKRHQSTFLQAGFLFLLFLLAFIPRAIYPVSRPLQWYFRSAQFFQAILEGNWAGTLFSEHPGVTVMWLSGAALWGWYGLQSLLGLHPPAPLETEGYAFADRVAVGVLPLALLVALGIVWGWYLLRRLFGRRVAWAAALLWTLDPFYLANSKLLHLDALLSTLMILSTLWILIYLRERRLRQLVTSAALAGLALLTKTSALFLIPFLALCLLTDLLRHPPSAISNLRSAICNCSLFIASLFIVCFVLWPSLWVQPAASLDLVIRRGVLLHAGSPRDQPLLYRGVLAVQNPGSRFYLDVLLFRTTFLTLPFALLGLVSAWGRLSSLSGRQTGKSALLLLSGFALFYFAQMSLGGWKDGRYMLPVLLALDVLAASGLLWWADRVHGITCLSTQEPVQRAATAEQSRCSFIIGHWSLVIGHWSLVIGHWSSPLLVGLLLAVQAAVVLPHHPYYGTHYNALLGGPRAALRVFPPADFGEGLDLAGQYVDSQPDAEKLSVGAQFLANEMLAQHVRAPVYDVTQIGEEADYLIFGVQYTMRGPIYPRWGALWEQIYKFREPEFVASFAGVPYAWVHRPGAEPIIPHHLDARLGETIHLEGYRLAQDEVAPDDTLLLTLYWRAEKPAKGDYTVFVHLQGPDGNLVAQQDNPPARGTQPTNRWQVGALIEDPYELALPPDAPVGDYQLSAGMYDPTTLERLPTFAPDGGRLPEDRVMLATVQVRPAVPWWHWALSATWLAVIAAGVVLPQMRRRE